MKTTLLSVCLILSCYFIAVSQCPNGTPDPGYTCIKDTEFEQYLVNKGWDTDATVNGQVLTSDISTRTSVDTYGYNVADLSGIEDFSSLQTLLCANSSLTSLDLSSNTNLLTLNCNNNALTSLNVSGCTSLYQIYCTDNELTSLNLSNKLNLQIVYLSNNPFLSTLDISGSTNIITFLANATALTTLDFSGNTYYLGTVQCTGSQLTSITIGASSRLSNIDLSDNQLTSLDLSNFGGHGAITNVSINCDNNLLTYLNVNNGFNSVITSFSALNNNLSCIQVDDATAAEAGSGSYSAWQKDVTASYSESCQNLGIPDDGLISMIRIFPNPSDGLVNISTQEPINYRLLSVQGQELSKGNFNSGIHTIDLSLMSKGIYFINIVSPHGQTTKKWIKL
ncbi:T9SS type A sorting domain-containing protein [Aestuariivivens sediminis]|uniref:T9SS type A sorting domain-containing protein n=1 Tax=Aestuariivivens sediminis TaxID=2913557 RepID=UPI001F588290|nr:T9SS type A sorting domain-containing protein [Aestuariivivens sediminis]